MLGTTAYPMYLVRGRSEGAIIEGGISALGPLLARQLAELGIGPALRPPGRRSPTPIPTT